MTNVRHRIVHTSWFSLYFKNRNITEFIWVHTYWLYKYILLTYVHTQIHVHKTHILIDTQPYPACYSPIVSDIRRLDYFHLPFFCLENLSLYYILIQKNNYFRHENQRRLPLILTVCMLWFVLTLPAMSMSPWLSSV